jgi:DNA polymerase
LPHDGVLTGNLSFAMRKQEWNMANRMDPDLSGAVGLIGETIRGRLEILQSAGISSLPRFRPGEKTPAKRGAPGARPADPTPAPLHDAALAIGALLEEAPAPQEGLATLQSAILGPCTRCKLHGGRKNIVFGVGNANADVVFVGEGPGANEDREGEPFVGRAGQLLTRMIEGGMGYRRSDVYICNVLKCRPPNNRDPEKDEVAACEPFLKAQLALIQPKVIVALGKFASQCLLQSNAPMGQLRGRWGSYAGIDVMPTFHPSYLLRSPERKREVWEDLKLILQRLGRPIPNQAQKPR